MLSYLLPISKDFSIIALILLTSYPEAYFKQIADRSMPIDTSKLPRKEVFLIPYLSVNMEDMGDKMKHAPTPAEPTRDASIEELFGFSSLTCFSNSKNIVPKELMIPNMIPLHRKLEKLLATPASAKIISFYLIKKPLY